MQVVADLTLIEASSLISTGVWVETKLLAKLLNVSIAVGMGRKIGDIRA